MTEDRQTAVRRIVIFLGINFLFSTVFYVLLIKNGLGGGNGLYVRGIMWCPALAAFLTCRLVRKDYSELGWKWKTRYQLASYLIPISYASIAYVATWVSGLGGFYNAETVQKIATTFGWQGLSPGVVIVLYFILAGTSRDDWQLFHCAW